MEKKTKKPGLSTWFSQATRGLDVVIKSPAGSTEEEEHDGMVTFRRIISEQGVFDVPGCRPRKTPLPIPVDVPQNLGGN